MMGVSSSQTIRVAALGQISPFDYDDGMTRQ
jgi:hypothetical protein